MLLLGVLEEKLNVHQLSDKVTAEQLYKKKKKRKKNKGGGVGEKGHLQGPDRSPRVPPGSRAETLCNAKHHADQQSLHPAPL